MEKKYHFITGLPRSGSTLLSNILKQNPRFHSSITDSLAPLIKGVNENAHSSPGIKTLINDEKKKKILTGLFDSFYYDYGYKPALIALSGSYLSLATGVTAWDSNFSYYIINLVN